MAATLESARAAQQQHGDHFDARAFDAEIEAHGVPVLWQRASVCPCLDPVRGTFEPDCPYCRDGTLWDMGELIRVKLDSRNRRDEYDVIGRRMDGRTTATFPSTVLPGHFDLLTLIAAELVVDNEFLTYGESDRLGRSRERTRMPVVRVERCASITPPPARELLFFTEGVDFTVNNGRDIAWTNPPPANSRYVLRYVARPVYICWSPMSRDENASKMPYRVEAQRYDFFRRESVGDPGGA